VTSETAGTSEDGFTFNDVLGMLFLDIIIFGVLAWYFGAVSVSVFDVQLLTLLLSEAWKARIVSLSGLNYAGGGFRLIEFS